MPNAATKEEIKAALYRATLDHFPDKLPASEVAAAKTAFAPYLEAHNVLIYSPTRAAFDGVYAMHIGKQCASDDHRGGPPPHSARLDRKAKQQGEQEEAKQVSFRILALICLRLGDVSILASVYCSFGSMQAFALLSALASGTVVVFIVYRMSGGGWN